MKIFQESSFARFLGIAGIALLICPLYLLLALVALKVIYSLKSFAWTKTQPYSPHFHWLLSYFNELKDVENQMMYLAIVLVIISCMTVLIIFWNENDILEEKKEKVVINQHEKPVSKPKKNK